MLDEFTAYIEEIYGGSHHFEELSCNAGIFTILVIENGPDKFKINLADKTRFGKFGLKHRNSGKFLDGTWGYHRQFVAWDLALVIFVAYTHYFNKSNGIAPELITDYKHFMQNYNKYILTSSFSD